MEIDFSPLFFTMIEGIAVVLSALVTVLTAWLGTKLKSKWGLEIEDRHRAALQDAMNLAIAFGFNKVKESLGGKLLTVELKNPVISMAASYLIASVPDALNSFGINPNSPEGKARIVEMVEARVSHYLFETEVVDDPFQGFDAGSHVSN